MFCFSFFIERSFSDSDDDDQRSRPNFGHARRKSHRRRIICQFDLIAKRQKNVFLQTFLRKFHRHPFEQLADVLKYEGTIDDQIDFIDTTTTRYQITPLIMATGKGRRCPNFVSGRFSSFRLGSVEKVKVLLVHGADPNKQCATGFAIASFSLQQPESSFSETRL